MKVCPTRLLYLKRQTISHTDSPRQISTADILRTSGIIYNYQFRFTTKIYSLELHRPSMYWSTCFATFMSVIASRGFFVIICLRWKVQWWRDTTGTLPNTLALVTLFLYCKAL